jgi:predicted GNAT family N-acyltransferase
VSVPDGAGRTVVVRPVRAGELATAIAIRTEVFVDEQHVPPELEADEHDAQAVHLLAWYGGHPVGTARLVREQPGFAGLPDTLGPVAHLGRIAVRATARRRGVGAALVHALHERAWADGLRVAYLGAQEHAVGFYRRLGYAVFGAPFDDAGIVHRHMWRPITGPGT